MRSAEAGGFGLGDCGGVEFAVGGVYDGFVVVYVEGQVIDFFSGRSVDVALDHGVVAYLFVLVDFEVLVLSTIFICVIFQCRLFFTMISIRINSFRSIS